MLITRTLQLHSDEATLAIDILQRHAQSIFERAGGYRPLLYLKIENPPYKAMVPDRLCESRGLSIS